MLTHYIKTAFRNLLKYKVQSIICILGVSIGLVSFILGYQWLKYETSFDDFHPKSSNIYRITGIETFRLFTLLAILSVLISLFGIYSISYSNMERRKREIAIRKVMGGSTKNITGMFIREYITISLLANLLFIPFAWYFINQWLDQFPAKASVGWIEVILVILLSCILIILTVLGQIMKVSSENPAEVVKSE